MQAAVLAEDFAGLRNQALGLAERAGLRPEIRVVTPRRFWQWPAPPEGDLPPLLIGCGGAAAELGARLRPRGHAVVHVQHPRMDPKKFDLVVVQPHDGLTGPNIVVTRTALHRVTAAVLAEGRARWAPIFQHLPRPLVSVLVGGSNGRFRLDAAIAARLGSDLAEMMRRDRVGVALTPSRRTEPAAVAALRAAIAPLGGWVWDGAGENPYFGLLGCADGVVVTGDSVSMISEAAATGAPVFVAGLPGRSRRIAAFTASLVAARRVRAYAGRFDPWACAAIDDTDAAAAEMRRRIGW